MTEYDVVVNMPPKEKYTITLKILTIRKARPNIVETEAQSMTRIAKGYKRCIGECHQIKAVNIDNFEIGYKDNFRGICRLCRRKRNRIRGRLRRINKGVKPRGVLIRSKCDRCDSLVDCRRRVSKAWNVVCEERTLDDVARANLRAEGLR